MTCQKNQSPISQFLPDLEYLIDSQLFQQNRLPFYPDIFGAETDLTSNQKIFALLNPHPTTLTLAQTKNTNPAA